MHIGCHKMSQEAKQEHWQIAVINLGCNKMDRMSESERLWRVQEKGGPWILVECESLGENKLDGKSHNERAWEWEEREREAERCWEQPQKKLTPSWLLTHQWCSLESKIMPGATWEHDLVLPTQKALPCLSASVYSVYKTLNVINLTWTVNSICTLM